jgi:hypothetical protein
MRIAGTVLVASVALPAVPAASARTTTTAPALERYQSVLLGPKMLTLTSKQVRGRKRATLIVVFEIRNTGRVARRFEVGYYRSPLIRPGMTLNASVAFSTAGKVVCRSTATHRKPLTASFRIVD